MGSLHNWLKNLTLVIGLNWSLMWKNVAASFSVSNEPMHWSIIHDYLIFGSEMFIYILHLWVARILNYPIWQPAFKFKLSFSGFRKAIDMTISDRDLKTRIKINDPCAFENVCKRLSFCFGPNMSHWDISCISYIKIKYLFQNRIERP